jgi:hypothetical protein
MCKKDSILKMKKGDKVFISMNIADKNQTKYNIIEMKANDRLFLSLSDYNNCVVTRWKYLLPFLVFVFGLLLFRFIRYI